MNKISIDFLGTGNAIPTEQRNHTGILINYDSENMLFDCGEGIQRQFRLAKLSPSKITRIFITHWHGDHTLGIPGLLQTLAMSEYQKTLQIYGPKGTLKFMNLIKELLMNIKINIEVHEVSPGIVLENKDFLIKAEQMQHGTTTLAYSLIIKDKLRLNKTKIKKLKLPNSPLLGQLQSGKDITFNGKKIKASTVTYLEKGKKITIVLDTKMNDKAITLAKDSNLLIAESTFSAQDEDKAKDYEHLTAKDAATIAKKSKSQFLILTHISQRYEHNLKIIENEAKKIFKNIKIAKDLDSIEL